MLQFLLMLLGLAFPNDNSSIKQADNASQINQASMSTSQDMADLSGETGQILPKKKK